MPLRCLLPRLYSLLDWFFQDESVILPPCPTIPIENQAPLILIGLSLVACIYVVVFDRIDTLLLLLLPDPVPVPKPGEPERRRTFSDHSLFY